MSLPSLTQRLTLLLAPAIVGRIANEHVLKASSPGRHAVADHLMAHRCQRDLDQRPAQRPGEAGSTGLGTRGPSAPSGEDVNADSGQGQLPFSVS